MEYFVQADGRKVRGMQDHRFVSEILDFLHSQKFDEQKALLSDCYLYQAARNIQQKDVVNIIDDCPDAAVYGKSGKQEAKTSCRLPNELVNSVVRNGVDLDDNNLGIQKGLGK